MNIQPVCLTGETLNRIRRNEISNPEWSVLEEHLNHCADCRSRLESGEQDPDWTQDILPALASEEESPLALLDPETCEADQEAGSLDQVLRLLGPTDNPHMLGRIGQYEIVGVVGRGGMGVVFKAFEPSLNRMVAIKMLLPHLAASPAARKRFAREGKAAAAVIDDHVMPIHGVSEWQGTPYLVMRYSPGTNLQKRVEKQGPLELEEILRIGMQTAKGLAAAHAQGLVHRDVKPSNILLDGTVERAMLTDFGLARAADDATLTRSGVLAGTPQYMSPEQVKGEQVDSRADLFGLGCVLYTLCTGKPPFEGETSYAILRQITDGVPRPIREINPRIPSWLCGLIGRLMAKQPEKRPGSAQEVAEMLEGALAHVQQPQTNRMPASLNPSLLTKTKMKRVGMGVFFMVACLFTGLGCLLLVQTEPSDITGNWDGNEWGSVVLRKIGASSWEGTYSETAGKEPGNIALRWSRIERRFNGTWNEGNDARFGELSLRFAEGNLVGAYTTDSKSRVNPGTPRLADLRWIKAQKAGAPGGSAQNEFMGEKVEYNPNYNPNLANRVEKLKEIGKAIHNYEAAYGYLPPGDVRDANGKVLYSWRVLLLPYLGENEIYNNWKLDEAWDSPANKPLSDKIIQAYADPEKPSNLTRFKVLVGENTAWIPGPAGWNQSKQASPNLLKFTSFPNGASNTLAVVECGGGIPWASPGDLDYRPDNLPTEIILRRQAKEKMLGLLMDGHFEYLWPHPTKDKWNLLIARDQARAGNIAPKGQPGAGPAVNAGGMGQTSPRAIGFHDQKASPRQIGDFIGALTRSLGIPLNCTITGNGNGNLIWVGREDYPWSELGNSILQALNLPDNPATQQEKELAKTARLRLLNSLINAVEDQERASPGGIPRPGQREDQVKKIRDLARSQAEAHTRLLLSGGQDNAPLYTLKMIRVDAARVPDQIRALLKPLGQDPKIESEARTNSLVTRNFVAVLLTKLLDSTKPDGGIGIFEERSEAIFARLQLLEILKILIENEGKHNLTKSGETNPLAKTAEIKDQSFTPENLTLKYCPPEIGLTILVEWSKVTGQDLVVPVTRDHGFRFPPGAFQTAWNHYFSYRLLVLANDSFKREQNPDLQDRLTINPPLQRELTLKFLRDNWKNEMVKGLFANHLANNPKANPSQIDDAIQKRADQIQAQAIHLAATLVRQDREKKIPPSPMAVENAKPEECVAKLKWLLKPFGLNPVTVPGSLPNEVIYQNTTQGSLETNLLLLATDPRKDSDLNPEDLKIRWSRRMNVVELLGVITGRVQEKPTDVDPLAKPGETGDPGFIPENLKLKNCSPEIGLSILAEWSKVTKQDLVVPVTRENSFQFSPGGLLTGWKLFSYHLLTLADGTFQQEKNPDQYTGAQVKKLQAQRVRALGFLRDSSKIEMAKELFTSHLAANPNGNPLPPTEATKKKMEEIQANARDIAATLLRQDRDKAASADSTMAVQCTKPDECVAKLKLLLKPFGLYPVTRVGPASKEVTFRKSLQGNLEVTLVQLAADSRKDKELKPYELQTRWERRWQVVEFLGQILQTNEEQPKELGLRFVFPNEPNDGKASNVDFPKGIQFDFGFPLQEKQNQDKLAQIGEAILKFHQNNGHLPPSHVTDRNGRPLYSWRVLLLPYLGEEELYKKWKLEEAWDSPNNKPLSEKGVAVYGDASSNKTTFRVFTGKDGLFDTAKLENLLQTGKNLYEVNDTLRRTILVIEAGQKAGWAEPVDIALENNKDKPELGKTPAGGFRVFWADGKTGTLPEATPREHILMLATPNGGEVVPGFYEADKKPEKATQPAEK